MAARAEHVEAVDAEDASWTRTHTRELLEELGGYDAAAIDALAAAGAV